MLVQREENAITTFMGVPTMYTYLLNAYDKMDRAQQRKAQEAARRLRLTVCGSSACPLPLMERWKRLSGEPAPSFHVPCQLGTCCTEISSIC